MKKTISFILVGMLLWIAVGAVGNMNAPYQGTTEYPVPDTHSIIPAKMAETRSYDGDVPSSLENTSFSLIQVSHNSPEANEICLSTGENAAYYMGWNDYRSVNWSNGYVHLGFSYSLDGGNTWSENQVLGNKTPGDMHDCAGDPLIIPGSGDDVYYVLMEFNESEAYDNSLAHSQLVLMKSSDHGQTWGPQNQIWPYDVDKPWGDYYNGDTYVAWDNVSTSKTEFSHSVGGDPGQWTSKIQIPGYNVYPYLVINDTGAVFVANVHWNSGDSAWNQMVVSVSTDGGASFGTQNVVGSVGSNSWGDNPRSGPIPSMAVKGSNVYVVWASNDSYSQVYLSESHDGGENWTVTQVGDITGSKIRYMYPSVAVDSRGTVHLEYYRFDNSTKEIDVIYRDYANGSMGSELTVDSWSNSNSFIGDYSSICADIDDGIGIGYTTENSYDNAMFAKLVPPVETNFHSGWNLISLPWQGDYTDISDALSGINWTRAMIYENGQWYTYNKERPDRYNVNFPYVSNSFGIWVYSSENATKYGPGTEPSSTSSKLHVGWNLVGYPSSRERNVSSALAGINYSLVEAYNTSSGNMEKLSPDALMEPGVGYWIYANEECTWTLDW